MGVEFRDGAVDSGAGAALAQEMRDEMAALYDGVDLDGENMPKAGPAELSPPGGAFLVGWRDGQPICCGGVKRLDARACEIKRMFVVPDARGQGVARALLQALEDRARALGYTIARLDTGPRQQHAERFYRAAGYAAIDNFNANPVASFWGEKPLEHR